MFCKYCGNEIKNEVTFCPNCGKKVKQINRELKKRNKEVKENNKTNTNKTIKRIIISIVVFALVLSSAGFGINFYNKLNGKVTYECTQEGIERVSKEICKNIKNGTAEIGQIKSFSDGDFSVYFSVFLSGKQEEVVKVAFENYGDSNLIGNIVIEMSSSSAYFNGENTYDSCIAVASSIEKTFLAWRYVDEYSDYSNIIQKLKHSSWNAKEEVLHSYIISQGPVVTISAEGSDWRYKLDLMK